ncbi:hypothetical protein EXN65_18975 [Clostridium botulinum]|uniref:Uncharacterized protein n=1 Tax=Clostridium botulinum TaxID=1491 RepID=A0A846I833_CLOBO|nr:hypothetical protein AGE29_07725 [Clostridium botulinum]NEZ88235.1 hypothetical protein [Clostridium botulinum]NEZ93765.1 hypothetical protein [Clostridium botulinum]NFB02435.1 hypothetical protein [Clostridium botulinum]NFB33311.1 hypothetical protein [Clostridium botulinum]
MHNEVKSICGYICLAKNILFHIKLMGVYLRNNYQNKINL